MNNGLGEILLCNEYVYLSLYLHISKTTWPVFKYFVHAESDHGLVHLRQCCTFCTSSFVDDVMNGFIYWALLHVMCNPRRQEISITTETAASIAAKVCSAVMSRYSSQVAHQEWSISMFASKIVHFIWCQMHWLSYAYCNKCIDQWIKRWYVLYAGRVGALLIKGIFD